nr:DUF4340 domain-containing protein [Aneurinibacillus sp. XH2]
MKKFIPTLVLVILCISGFWYASSQNWFKEPEGNKTKELVSIAADDVKEIKISSPEGETVRLVKSDGGWTMSEPMGYPVNRFTVENWLSTFTVLPYNEMVEENAEDLKPFGFESPARQFEVSLKDGSVITVVVGSELPVGDGYYAKLGDSNAVYSLAGTSVQGLDKQTLDFLDKKVFKAEYNKINHLSFTWKGESWQLDKLEPDKTAYESKWSLNGQELEANAGSAVLDKLTLIATSQLPLQAGSLQLETPELRVELKEGKGEEEKTIRFVGQVKDDQFLVVREGDEWAYSINEADLKALMDNVEQARASAAEAASGENTDDTPAEPAEGNKE